MLNVEMVASRAHKAQGTNGYGSVDFSVETTEYLVGQYMVCVIINRYEDGEVFGQIRVARYNSLNK